MVRKLYIGADTPYAAAANFNGEDNAGDVLGKFVFSGEPVGPSQGPPERKEVTSVFPRKCGGGGPRRLRAPSPARLSRRSSKSRRRLHDTSIHLGSSKLQSRGPTISQILQNN